MAGLTRASDIDIVLSLDIDTTIGVLYLHS